MIIIIITVALGGCLVACMMKPGCCRSQRTWRWQTMRLATRLRKKSRSPFFERIQTMYSLRKKKRKKTSNMVKYLPIFVALSTSLIGILFSIFNNKLPGTAVPVHRDAFATRQLALAHEAQPWKHPPATSKTCTTWDVLPIVICGKLDKSTGSPHFVHQKYDSMWILLLNDEAPWLVLQIPPSKDTQDDEYLFQPDSTWICWNHSWYKLHSRLYTIKISYQCYLGPHASE